MHIKKVQVKLWIVLIWSLNFTIIYIANLVNDVYLSCQFRMSFVPASLVDAPMLRKYRLISVPIFNPVYLRQYKASRRPQFIFSSLSRQRCRFDANKCTFPFPWPLHHAVRATLPPKKVTNPPRVGYLFRIAAGRSARFGTAVRRNPGINTFPRRFLRRNLMRLLCRSVRMGGARTGKYFTGDYNRPFLLFRPCFPPRNWGNR